MESKYFNIFYETKFIGKLLLNNNSKISDLYEYLSNMNALSDNLSANSIELLVATPGINKKINLWQQIKNIDDIKIIFNMIIYYD
jgi:hypothetical protein